MTLCSLSSTTVYDCTNLYPNCTNKAGFQFASLWIITKAIYDACPNDTRLFKDTEALTQEACEVFAGSSWTVYPKGDIWARLATWKFPLLQLVAVFPRPPLNLRMELFVLAHLMGDPISTVSNLLLKMASCQSRALFWKNRFARVEYQELIVVDDPYGNDIQAEVALVWKGLAAIIDSYDEWGQEVGDKAREFIDKTLICPSITLRDRRKFLKICRLTGNALAADRSTKFLPIAVAEGFFIGSIAVAYGRTRQSATGANPQTFINIEAFSVAFSALYFWIIPAVFLASVIGVSQTENAVPRILKRFRKDVQRRFPGWAVQLPTKVADRMTTTVREQCGGIYSWAPAETRRSVKANILPDTEHQNDALTRWESIRHTILSVLSLQPGSLRLPFFAVSGSAFTGLLISYLVPPVGFECRHFGEFFMYLAWVVSAALNFVPFRSTQHTMRANFILGKDIVATLATVTGIIVTQVGVFNRCSCYTRWGRVGLALPEWSPVSHVLFGRIGTAYPAIAFTCIGIMLFLIPLLIARHYELAVRVFLQRDDGVSNLDWLHDVVRLPENIGRVIRNLSGKVKKLCLRMVWGRQVDHYELPAAQQPQG
ncbi:uncharacterized protein RCO7_04247 [Rhynchosporium graminicola]|uniref:Uncharacterized protein n=1 Tax=Rhynchosporium graminicola TaxID=2792576 RepID=A0A1E1LRH3_9HELO|nr:uncharacterized protein RCO7_04247 [Rhynchosporium commune]